MLVSEMQEELALMAHDPANAEVSPAQWMMFMNSAARDARTSGWLVRATDDVSITIAASTYNYAIPTPFAYVQTLWQEETQGTSGIYVQEVPRNHWDIRMNPDTGVPEFYFGTLTYVVNGKHLRIIGQQRPTIYTSPAQTVDPGMEGFFRERALYFGFRYLGAGGSDLAKWRQDMAKQSYLSSEQMLHRQPQEMRELPNSIEVPGRG